MHVWCCGWVVVWFCSHFDFLPVQIDTMEFSYDFHSILVQLGSDSQSAEKNVGILVLHQAALLPAGGRQEVLAPSLFFISMKPPIVVVAIR